jgi:hypothetical protein
MQTIVPLESRIARKPEVPWKELDGVAIILVLDTGEYFELDEVALEIWKMLSGDKTLLECANELGAAYDAPSETVQGDVQAFAMELLERNLVTVVSQ